MTAFKTIFAAAMWGLIGLMWGWAFASEWDFSRESLVVPLSLTGFLAGFSVAAWIPGEDSAWHGPAAALSAALMVAGMAMLIGGAIRETEMAEAFRVSQEVAP